MSSVYQGLLLLLEIDKVGGCAKVEDEQNCYNRFSKHGFGNGLTYTGLE